VKRLCALVLCALLLALPRVAAAHTIGLSNGEYRVEGDAVLVTIVFARGELMTLVKDLDRDHDGAVTEHELSQASAAIEAGVVPLVVPYSAGEPCTGALSSTRLVEQDGISVAMHYACKPGAPRRVDVRLFSALPKGHRHLFREVRAGAPPRDDILFSGHEQAALVGTSGDPAAPDDARPSGFFAFFRLGLEHILTGYDHLVFLFGLVLVRGRPRDYVGVVTAFTLAHSVTLGLSVLGVVHPSPRLVEPAIALSIVYVGVENFIVKDATRRWRITFPFGLLHGFGFAGALTELDLPRTRVPGALVAFNLGVEAGQLAALAVALPLVLAATKRHTRAPLTRALSVAVAVAGGAWFVARVAG